jgi:hypothetical protein
MTTTADLYAALFAAVALSPYLPNDRVHEFRPRVPAFPAVWLADVRTYLNAEQETVVTIDVVACVDGDDTAQLRAQLTYADAIHDAIWSAMGRPVSREPTTLDVGGPNLRAVTVTAEFLIPSPTLCPPDPIGATRHV